MTDIHAGLIEAIEAYMDRQPSRFLPRRPIAGPGKAAGGNPPESAYPVPVIPKNPSTPPAAPASAVPEASEGDLIKTEAAYVPFGA